MRADFIFEHHGSIWLVRPTTDEAREHLTNNTGEEAQWWAGALVVEPRYVEDLATNLRFCGYTVWIS